MRTSAVAALFFNLVFGVQAHAAPASLVLAGGCFWGIEAVFEHTKGVISATSGYVGGSADTAQYETVSMGHTGHAESVRVVYDPARINLDQLLDIYFTVAHDPTQLNRQGPDHGTHYRSALFYTSRQQKAAFEAKIASLTQAKIFAGPIVTTVVPLSTYYLAEPYHQNYAAKHPRQPYIVIHDAPKLNALKARFPTLYVK